MTFAWDGPSEGRTKALLAAGFPQPSDAERRRRRAAIEAAATDQGCDLVLVYGADRAGSGVPWLTGWPVTREAALLVDLVSGEDLLLVQFHNHVPLASRLALGCEVRWGGPATSSTLTDELDRRGARDRRLGLVGPVGFRLYDRVGEHVSGAVDLGAAYTRARLVKSSEELDWMAVGAHLSDLSVLALRDGLHPGIVDHELADLVERAYTPLGGTNHIHYFAITAMRDPQQGVPSQVTTGQRVTEHDVVVTELSTSFGGYAGQVLRTMTMADELDPLFAELHEVADTAFDRVCAAIRPGATPADVVEAAGVIEEAGFTVIDDLVHGYGGGYLPPVIGTASRSAGPLPDLTFESGMTVVVQPNVTSTDRRAGVQTGELVVVTDDGVRSLHAVPRGPWVGVGRGPA